MKAMIKLNNAAEVWQQLREAQTIAITTHINPDGDALGALIAFYEAMKSFGKEAFMVVDDTIPKKFDFLSSLGLIEQPEAVRTKSPDVLVVLDASTEERIGEVATLWQIPVVNIDHHISNEGFADYLYLHPEAAASGEMLVYLFKDWEIGINKEMANALYLAIATDCGFFRYSNTTAATLEAAALCVKSGAHVQRIAETVDAVTIARFEAIKQAIAAIELYDEGYIGMMALTKDTMTAIDNDTDGFIDFIRNIDSVELSILLKEVAPTVIKVSLRSKSIDVNALANHFGGGGHIRASGCTLAMTLEEAKETLLTVVREKLEAGNL